MHFIRRNKRDCLSNYSGHGKNSFGGKDMAGTMVHLLVAEKLKERLLQRKWQFPFNSGLKMDSDFFIAGNICPDGIMARKDYERQMKLHTHFRDGIPDGRFEEPGMVPLFERRMKSFWEEHFREEEKCPGLHLGYVTHMMTDEKFILEERPKFFQNIASTGLTCKDRETFMRFNRETDLVDFKLIREYQELQDAKRALQRVPEYEIQGMVAREELTDSRNWILGYFFETEHPVIESEFLLYNSMVEFIETAAEEIMERLFAEGYLIE